MHILHIVGARPNFMKAAPVVRALQQRSNVRQTLVHTGQHYDANMSGVFFEQLGIPKPDVNLEVGSGSHAEQTAAVMSRFEPVLLERKPDIVLVRRCELDGGHCAGLRQTYGPGRTCRSWFAFV
jgi:UDP-N-acetylglucosamine 2-epimerase (non-hydrolysing)